MEFAVALIVLILASTVIFSALQHRDCGKQVSIVVTIDTGEQMRMATSPETAREDFSSLLNYGFYTNGGRFYPKHAIRTAHVVFDSQQDLGAAVIESPEGRVVRVVHSAPQQEATRLSGEVNSVLANATGGNSLAA